MMRWTLFFILIVIAFACTREDIPLDERRYTGLCGEELFSLDTLKGYYEGISYIMYFRSDGSYYYPPESFDDPPMGAIQRNLYYSYEFQDNNIGFWHYPDTSISFDWQNDRRSKLMPGMFNTECDFNYQILVINEQDMYLSYDTLYKSDFNTLCFEGWTKDYVNPYYDSVIQEFDGYYIQAIAEFFQRR